MKSLLLLSVVFFALACTPEYSDDPAGKPFFDKTGYRPIYQSESEINNVLVGVPTALSDPGKIYLREPYLFINERGRGIHIFDNADPKNPRNISFISIPANFDIAVKDDWLYADNASDLLVFDISDPKQPKLKKRIEDAIPLVNYPPYTNVYFECADAKKGIVMGWEKVDMPTRPGCYR